MNVQINVQINVPINVYETLNKIEKEILELMHKYFPNNEIKYVS